MATSRLRTRFDWLQWTAVAVIVLVGLLEIFGAVAGQHWNGPRAVAVAALLIIALPLGVVRTHPAVSVFVPALVFGAYMAVWGQPSSSAAVFIIILVGFGWGRYRGDRRRVIWVAIAVFALGGGLTGDNPPTDVIFFLGMIAAAFAAGRLVSNYQRLAEQLRAQQPLVARAAVIDERTRIARELHDVVAHGVSVMVIQSVAGRTLLRRDPDQAEEAMHVVETTGKDALAELRRLLGVLRADDGDAAVGVRPQPGLGDLDRLVASVRESGLRVQLEVVGHGASLTPGVDLAAYRIVQEALTNVIRHAGTDEASVRVEHEAHAVVLEILNGGNGSTKGASNGRPPAAGGGHGVPGMRERAALYGGEVEAGPRDGGGYAVRARLPVDARA